MTERIRLRDAELKGRMEGLQLAEQLAEQLGEQQGIEKTLRQMIASMHSRQFSDETIADICNISMKELYRLTQPAE